MNQPLPLMTECPACGGYGYGVRNSGVRCWTCGGCGELFDGLKFADYRRAKEVRERAAESPKGPSAARVVPEPAKGGEKREETP